MMNPGSWKYLIAVTVVTAGVTVLLRALPFLAFGAVRRTPKWVAYLGKMLSPAAIAMLVVYCYCASFQNRSWPEAQWGLPELVSGLLVVLMQLKWKNPLVSILSGTLLYMVWIQNFM